MLEQVLSVMFSTTAHSSRARKDSLLTERQVDVLELLANGVDCIESLRERDDREPRDAQHLQRSGVNDATQAVSEAYQKHRLKP